MREAGGAQRSVREPVLARRRLHQAAVPVRPHVPDVIRRRRRRRASMPTTQTTLHGACDPFQGGSRAAAGVRHRHVLPAAVHGRRGLHRGRRPIARPAGSYCDTTAGMCQVPVGRQVRDEGGVGDAVRPAQRRALRLRRQPVRRRVDLSTQLDAQTMHDLPGVRRHRQRLRALAGTVSDVQGRLLPATQRATSAWPWAKRRRELRRATSALPVGAGRAGRLHRRQRRRRNRP